MILSTLALLAMTGNVSPPPYILIEPQKGYLSTFTWTGDIPYEVYRSNQAVQISGEVLKAMKANSLPGAAVVVMQKDKIIYRASFGYANLTTQEPFLPATASRCGSISKTATALAILKLVDQEKLSLDDKAIPILTQGNLWDFGGNAAEWDKIRVRDLLDHASGLPSNAVYLTSHDMAKTLGKTMRLNLDDLLRFVLKNQQLTSVGDKYAYTNLNFELLSRIVERKTGLSYANALQQLVVKPLGIPPSEMFLSPTRSVPPDVKLDRNDKPPLEARCYQKNPKLFSSIFQVGPQIPEAYGGLDGDILSGAGHIAFSAQAIAQMVLTLRTRPTTYLKQKIWDELLKPPGYVGKPGNNKTATYFYSKGTNVTKYPDGTYGFDHGAMLMHAAGNYLPYNKDIEIVVIANSNTASGALADQILVAAVQKGLVAAGK